MFSDVLVALRRCTLIEQVLVVSGDHGAQRIAAGYGAMVLEDEERGHNEAATLGVAARARAAARSGRCWCRATARCWTPPSSTS